MHAYISNQGQLMLSDASPCICGGLGSPAEFVLVSAEVKTATIVKK